MSRYVHFDLGRSFTSHELKDYLLRQGVENSHSTTYHACGNVQVERYNGFLWKTITVFLKSRGLPVECSEAV